MSTPRTPTAAELIVALERDGFAAGAPFHLRDWARHVDQDLCEHMECPFCGHLGLTYRPFRRGVGSGFRYRAVCECSACAYGFELYSNLVTVASPPPAGPAPPAPGSAGAPADPSGLPEPPGAPKASD